MAIGRTLGIMVMVLILFSWRGAAGGERPSAAEAAYLEPRGEWEAEAWWEISAGRGGTDIHSLSAELEQGLFTRLGWELAGHVPLDREGIPSLEAEAKLVLLKEAGVRPQVAAALEADIKQHKFGAEFGLIASTTIRQWTIHFNVGSGESTSGADAAVLILSPQCRLTRGLTLVAEIQHVRSASLRTPLSSSGLLGLSVVTGPASFNAGMRTYASDDFRYAITCGVSFDL